MRIELSVSPDEPAFSSGQLTLHQLINESLEVLTVDGWLEPGD